MNPNEPLLRGISNNLPSDCGDLHHEEQLSRSGKTKKYELLRTIAVISGKSPDFAELDGIRVIDARMQGHICDGSHIASSSLNHPLFPRSTLLGSRLTMFGRVVGFHTSQLRGIVRSTAAARVPVPAFLRTLGGFCHGCMYEMTLSIPCPHSQGHRVSSGSGLTTMQDAEMADATDPSLATPYWSPKCDRSTQYSIPEYVPLGVAPEKQICGGA